MTPYKKKVKLIKIGNKNDLYLVSNDELEQGDSFIDTKRCLVSEYKETITGGSQKKELVVCTHAGNYFKDDCKKIIAKPEQIGKVPVDFFGTTVLSGRDLGELDVEKIISNDGDCEILMDVFMSEDNGYRVPKLINNKVIICL